MSSQFPGFAKIKTDIGYHAFGPYRRLDHRRLDHRRLDHRRLDHRRLDHRRLDHRRLDHLFLGAIPRQLCEQLVRVLSFAEWQDVFVCCSGSFRVDQAIHQAAPDARVHANDVSLYSTVIGRLATKEPFALTFADRLAFVEDVLKVYNTAVAMRLICDLATDHLDLLEAQERDAQAKDAQAKDAQAKDAQAKKEAVAPTVELSS